MKNNDLVKIGLGVFTALFLGSAFDLQAQTYSWDPGASGSGATDGSGTWDAATTADWYTGTIVAPWNNNGSIIASIGSSTAGTNSSPNTLTIASSTTILVDGITFNNVTPYVSSSTGENTGYTIAPTDSTSIISLGGTGQIVDNTAATTVSIISAQITGSAGLTKSGTGILALTGNDIYTGGTTISAGTLQIGNGGNAGAIVGNIADNSVLAYDNSGNNNISITISGSGSLQQEAGTLNLSGSNTYSGGTTISGGTLKIGSSSALGSTTSGLTINGGVLDLTGTSLTIGTLNGTGGVVQNSSGTGATLTVGSGGTYSGNLVGGNLSLNESSGTLILTGANTYTGTTTVGGTLQFGNGSSIGSFNSSGNVTNNGSLIFDNSNTTSQLSGIISGSGSLTQEGTGSTVILTGANTYSGSTTISAGTLQIGNGVTTGSLAAGTSVADNGTLVFDNTGGTETLSGVVSGTGNLTQEGPANTLILTGANTYSGTTSILSGTLQIGNGGTTGSISSGTNIANKGILIFDNTSSSAITQSGIISGTGSLTQEGTGSTLILSGANTYTGTTTVTSGTLQVGNANALGASTSSLAVDGTGTVDLHGFSITIGTLSTPTSQTGGTILDNGANATLSIGSNGGSGTYAGVLANGTGTLSINLVGGVEDLTGTNTYTGGTTISGGTLQIGNTNALGASTNNLVINGGSLDLENFSITVNTLKGATGSISSLSGAGSLTVSNGGFFAGNITDGTSGTVSLTSTSGTLVLTGTNQYSGTTTISAGTLQIGSGGMTGTFNANGTGTAGVVDNGALVFDTASATAISQITGVLSGTGTLTQEGAGSTLILSGANTFSGGTTIKAGTIQIGNAGALDGSSGTLVMTGGTLDLHGNDITLETLNGTAGTVLSNTANAVLTVADGGIYSGNLTDGSGGTLGLDVSGGTLILNGTGNTYSGGTTVAGTLQIGSGGSAGSISSTGNIADSGSVVFDTSSSLGIGGVISGTGTVTQRGIGSVTFSGVNTYTGATFITGGGTLNLTATTGSLSSSTHLTFGGAGGTFAYNNAGSTTARSQSIGTLTFSSGEGKVQSNYGSGSSSATLHFSSLATRTAGATGNFVTSGGTNGTNNNITIAGQATGFINRGIFFDGGTGSASYAFYDASGYVRGIVYGTDTGSILSTGGATIATSDTGNASSTIGNSSNVEITGAITAQTTIQIGTLQISGANNFTQAASTTLTVDGILKTGGNAATISGGSLTSNSSTDLVIRADQAGDVLTISDPITSTTTGGITKSGAGTLILSGDNAYTGTTTLDAGTLKMANANALGSSSNALIVNGGTLDLNANSLSVSTLNGGGGTILTNTGAATLTIASGGTFGGALTDGTGVLSLTQTAGTLILTGANTYSGTTTVTAGTLQIGSAGTAGTLNTTGGISLGSGTALVFDNSTPGASSSIGGVISGGGSLTQEGAGSTVILTGADTYSGSTMITAGTLQIGNGGTTGSIVSTSVTDNGALVFDTTNSTPLTFSATISGTGTVTQEGAGSTLILTGANTYTGGTFVSGGTLELGNGTVFGSGQNQVTITGGTIDLHGHSTTLANLNGTGGTLLTNTANATLTVTGGGVYGGDLTDGTSGVLTLIQTGGTLQLSGTNTYTGGTTVTGGLLTASSAGALSGAVTIDNNAGLALLGGGTYDNTLSLIGIGSDASSIEGVTGALYFDANNATANMTGGITLNGPTVFTENGTGSEAWNFTGGITGTGGLTLNATGTGNIIYGLGGTNTFTGGLVLTQTGQGSSAPAKNAEIQLLSSTAIPTGTRLSLNSSTGLVSALDLNGFNATLANLVGSVGGTSEIINTSATAATLTLANTGTDTWAGLLGGTPYGSVTAANNLSIALTGNTDLILTGANTYTGGSNIASGTTLQIGNGGTTGSAGTGAIVDNGALIFDIDAPITLAQIISGSGSLTQESGFGDTVTLSGADTYTGTTTISGGTIDLAANTGSLNGTTGTALIFQSFAGSAGGTFNYDNTGSTGAKSQGMGVLTLSAGDANIQSTLGSATSSALSFTSMTARAAGATGNFVTSGGTNGSTNTISIGGQATGFMGRGFFFDGGTANASYAYYDGAGYVRGVNYGVDSNTLLSTGGATIASSDTGNAANTMTSTSNVETTGAITAQTTIQIGTLQISGANNFTQTSGSTLTTSGILKSGGNAATISGGSLTSGSSLDMVIRVDQSGDTLTISDPITSSTTGGVVKSGAGTLVLTGGNTYTGGTIVDGGTLQIGTGTAAGTINGTGSLLVEGGSGVVFDNSSNSVFGGTIGGAGTLTQEGTGTLLLTGADTYTGTTTISSGALQVGNGTSGSLSANTLVVDDASLILDTSSFSALITGTGSVTEHGGASDPLFITGAETYTGATIIDGGGTLELFASLGSLNGTTGTALTFNGAGGIFDYANAGSLSARTQGMKALSFNSGEGEVESVYGNTGSSATISFTSLAARTAGATGDFVTSGGTNGSNNNITIAGQATGFINSGIFFDGGTSSADYAYYDAGGFVRGINYGVDSNSILSTGGTTIASNDTGNASSTIDSTSNVETTGAITAQTTVQIGTLQISGAHNFTQAGSTTLTVAGILKSGGNAATLSGGSLTSNSSTDMVIRVDQSGDTLTISDPITSTTTGGITKSGAGTLVLSGGNAYTGTTTVDAGTLQASNSTALGSTSNGLAVNGGTLDVEGNAFTVGSLNGAGGAIQNNGAATTLTDSNGGSFAGVIKNGTGTLGLTQTSGTQILTGANTYTGATTLTGTGTTLQIGNGGTTGSLSTTTAISLGSGTSLVFDNTNSTAATLGGVISGAGSLTQEGFGNTLILTNTDTYSGGTTITAGTLQIGNGGSTGSISSTANVTDNGGLVFDTTNASTTIGGIVSGTGSLTQEGLTNTLLLTNANTYSGGTTIAAGTLQIGNGGTTGSISSTGVILDDGSLLFDNTSSSETIGGGISGTGSLTQEGAGNTLILTGADTYSGGTTITAGTLQIGNGGTTGSLSPTGAIADNGALVFDNTSTTPATISSVISGTGSLTQEGAGSTVILTGVDTYSGATTISAGTLQIGNGGVSSSIASAGNIADNGALVFDTSLNASIYSGIISGTGSVTQEGSSIIYLTGVNTYTGGTTVDAGSTLQLGQGATGSIVGDVTDNGTLVFDNHANLTFVGVFTGDGTISQLGGGTLTFTGDSSTTFTGEYLIGAAFDASGTDILGTSSSVVLEDNGIFDISAADSSQTVGSLASSATTDFGESVNLGSNTLTFGDSSSTTFVGVISGNSGSLVKQGTGSFTATAANTYGGGTTVEAGTFLADNTSGSATGTGNVTVDNTGTFGGTGTITPSASHGITVMSGGDITPGGAPIGTVATGYLSITNASTNHPVLTFDAPTGSTATTPQMTFELGTGAAPVVSGLTLAGSSSYIAINNAAGDSPGEVVFNGNYVQLTDASSGGLAYGNYLLFQAPNAGDYSNLILNANSQITSGLYLAPDPSFDADYSAVLEMSGGDIYVDVGAVPEPGTWAMLFGGLVMLIGYRLRGLRRRKA